jgi:class 3 adenylate cyclase
MMAAASAARDGMPAGAVADAFSREQKGGLTVALQGRMVVLAIFALWIGFTRSAATVFYMEALIAAFAAIGLLQLWIVHRIGVRAWPLYLFMFIEISLLTVAVVVYAAPFTHEDLPVTMVYRFFYFDYFFLFVAGAAFSYAPGLVLWTGISVAVAWGLGSAWVVATNDTLEWTDIPANFTGDEFMAVVLDPTFMGYGSRIQEVIVLLSVAGLLAIVAWRARRLVFRQVEAERERTVIAETFGQYVPEAVAKQLIADAGSLAPQEREATVLITDIEGFTTTAEAMAPPELLAMLDEYFDVLGQIIVAQGGVVNQFHGDSLIATFNVPAANDDHAAAAIRAGLAIDQAVRTTKFRGQTLKTRIGLNTGSVVSGSVGSRGRRSYTVYGDAVNEAARIEAMNKEFGTTLLVSGTTAASAGDHFRYEPLGSMTMRGKSEATALFGVAPCGPAPPPLASEPSENHL